MSGALDNLGCQVLRRPTERVRHFVTCDLQLAQAEIRQFDVTFAVEDHVFGLQVSVDDAVAVQAFERQDYLGCVEACTLL